MESELSSPTIPSEAENSLPQAEASLISSNITSNELDTDTANKLRGDAIGDTMYSEVFVLKTLMKFKDLQWNSELEDELCFLWDMTQEKVVCDYLFKMSYPSLACSTLTKYRDNDRFVEIVIGIFANILCVDQEKSLTMEEIDVVLSVLQSDDPLILIQVMRFVHAISFRYEKLVFITKEIYDQFNFILNNSVNCDLLLQTLNTLATIIDYSKLNENILSGDILQSITTAYQTITNDSNNEPNLVAMKYLVQTISSVCVYIDDLEVIRLIDESKQHLHLFLNVLKQLFNFYTKEENLIPVTDELEFYIESFLFIFEILPVNYSSEIIVSLCKMLLMLNETENDAIDNFVQLISYFLITGEPEIIQKDLNNKFSERKIELVLKIVRENTVKCKSNYLSKLENILQKLC